MMGFVWKMRTPAHRCKININKMLGPPRFIVHLPQVSCDFEVEKALHPHRYKRKYRHNGEWVYIYETSNHHIHTHWNHEKDSVHAAPKELHKNKDFRPDGPTEKHALKVGTETPIGGEGKGSDSHKGSGKSSPREPKIYNPDEGVSTSLSTGHGEKIKELVESIDTVYEFEDRPGVEAIGVGKGANGSLFRHSGPPPVIVKFGDPRGVEPMWPSEAEIQKRMGDLGIAPKVYGYRIEGDIDSDFIAMEECEYALADVKNEGEKLKILEEAMNLMEKMHKEGVAHKDTHTNNIMVRGGQTLIIDFGLASEGHGVALLEAAQKVGSPTREYIKLLSKQKTTEDGPSLLERYDAHIEEYRRKGRSGEEYDAKKEIDSLYKGVRSLIEKHKG